MYGDEETGTPPNELYDKEDTEEALRWADYVASNVLRLYRELVGEELSSS